MITYAVRTKLQITLLSLLCLLSFSVVALPAQASAQVDSRCNRSGWFLGLPTWYKYLDVEYKDGRCDITGPKTTNDDGEKVFDWRLATGRIALAAVEILLRIASLIAVGFIIYGGFQYILSQGEPDRIKNAKQTIINALIGLVIAMLSVAVVNLISNSLIK